MKVDGSNSVAKTNNNGANKPATLKQWVAKMTDQIAMALPANITPERMARIAMTALSKNEMLAQSTPESFLGALLTSAQLGLECNTPLGQAYLIPYKNGKTGRVETQFQLGYQGMLDLCYRTKQYKTIQARVVYEGDDFDYSYGFNETLRHIPRGKTSKPVYVYAYYELVSSGHAFEVMSWNEVMKFSEQYSQSVKYKKSSPWQSDPEAMAKKTVLKKVMKYAPKTVEIADAVANDSAILSANVVNDGKNAFVDIVNTQPVIEETKPAEIEAPKADVKAESNYTPTDEEIAAEIEGADEAFEAQAEQYGNNGNPDALF